MPFLTFRLKFCLISFEINFHVRNVNQQQSILANKNYFVANIKSKSQRPRGSNSPEWAPKSSVLARSLYFTLLCEYIPNFKQVFCVQQIIHLWPL